jgi:phenylacetate-CoA ligase
LASGRHILDRLDSLQKTQWLSRIELEELQRKKIISLVEYAYQHVPYYRRIFDEIGFQPGDLKNDFTLFQRIPILTKEIIRSHTEELKTTDRAHLEQLSLVTTSGSTGQPLTFWQDHEYRDCVTADIQRHLEWAGAALGQPHAYIWGASFEVSSQQALRTQLIDWEWNRFLTNAFMLSEQSMADFAQLVIKKQPNVLYGYASSLYNFARFVRQIPEMEITFQGVISSAETLLPIYREYIEETFQCKVFDRYGSKELGGIACECEAHTGLHISAENNFIEILNHGKAAEPGEAGQIIVTNLNNRGMPFIRYSIDDEGAWSRSLTCICGRGAPMLEKVEGRLVDTFWTPDGRKVWAGFAGAGYSCLSHPSIKQFQVIQESLDHLIIRVVRDGEVPQETMDQFSDVVHTVFGENMEVHWEFPDEIPVLPSGKHQYAVCKISEGITNLHMHPMAPANSSS